MSKISALILILLTLCASPVVAQTQDTPMAPDYTVINRQLDKITADLNSGKISRKETDDIIATLGTMQSQIEADRTNTKNNLQNITKKIDALGEIPENGAKEPEAIAKQRRQFNDTAAKYKSQIAQADLSSAKIGEINNLIIKVRNRQLLNNILVKQSSVFYPQELIKSLSALPVFFYDLAKSPFDWYGALRPEQKQSAHKSILYVVLTTGAALFLALLLRKYIKRYIGYKTDGSRPDYNKKFWTSVWMLVAYGIIPSAIFGTFLVWIDNSKLLSGNFKILLYAATLYLLIFFICRALIQAALTPESQRWRIIEINNDRAAAVNSALIFSAAAICCVEFLLYTGARIKVDGDILYSLTIFANLVKAYCVIVVAQKSLYDDSDPTPEELQGGDLHQLSTSSKISLLINGAMIVAFGISLLGYLRLSEYIINRFIASLLVISLMYIVNRLLRGIFHQITRFRFWQRTLRVSPRTLVRSEIWFGLILAPVLFLFSIIVILAVWGVSVDIIIGQIKNFLIGFNIGSVRISITSILLGIIVFMVSLFAFRLLKRSFQSGSLSQLGMDDGVKSSIISGIGFLGFIFSFILGIAVMGGSFQSIALMAGALSFGAGLGLQNLVSNLVAGITILFERPVKVGDWVIINGQEGIVKQINMRSTTLETGNKSTVIIPNSDILSSNVINKTYMDRAGKVEIKLGVDYNSDIALVRNALLEIADKDPEVLKTPAPSLAFLDLGDNSLNFQLNCYTDNVFNNAEVANRLRENIVNVFRAKNINIPFPQRVVHYTPADSLPSRDAPVN